MRMGVLVNRIESQRDTYTTAHLCTEAIKRGHEVWVVGVENVSYNDAGEVAALSTVFEPHDVVDTTGAGDAFHAGAAWALLEGHPWGESLRRAAAVAAWKCRRPGARAGLPDRAEVLRFLDGLTASGKPSKLK